MGGKLFTTLRIPGLARDFFSKFVNDTPVSPQAKIAFADQFPRLLRASGTSSSYVGGEGEYREERRFATTPEDGNQVIKPSLTAPTLTPSISFARYLKSLHRHQYRDVNTDWLCTVFIVLNCLVLVMISLPPGARSYVKRKLARAKSVFVQSQAMRRSVSYDNIHRHKPTAISPKRYSSHASIHITTGALTGRRAIPLPHPIHAPDSRALPLRCNNASNGIAAAYTYSYTEDLSSTIPTPTITTAMLKEHEEDDATLSTDLFDRVRRRSQFLIKKSLSHGCIAALSQLSS